MASLNKFPHYASVERYYYKVEVNTSGDWLGRKYICQLYLTLGKNSPLGRDMRWAVLGKAWTPEGAQQIGERFMGKWLDARDRVANLQTAADRLIEGRSRKSDMKPKSLSDYFDAEIEER